MATTRKKPKGKTIRVGFSAAHRKQLQNELLAAVQILVAEHGKCMQSIARDVADIRLVLQYMPRLPVVAPSKRRARSR